MNTREKEEIWKEYFDKLLNTEEPRELIEKWNKEISEVEVEGFTIEDVERAIRNLKNNKVDGTDGIHPELIKYGGNKLLNRTYEGKSLSKRNFIITFYKSTYRNCLYPIFWHSPPASQHTWSTCPQACGCPLEKSFFWRGL